MPTKKPIRTVADFEGFKMRSPEEVGAALRRKIGVGVSTLPGSEVYAALERCKIGVTDWGTLGMNDEFGYGSIAPYAIFPGIHSVGAADVAMNLETWNALPEDLKMTMETAVKEFNPNRLMVNAIPDVKFVTQRDPSTLID